MFGTLEHTRATAEEKTADALPVNAKYVAAQEETVNIWLEHEVAFGNPLVAGSSPARPTKN